MKEVSLSVVSTNRHALRLDFAGKRIKVFYDAAQEVDVIDNSFDGLAAYLSGGISADIGQSTMSVGNVIVRTTPTAPQIQVP